MLKQNIAGLILLAALSACSPAQDADTQENGSENLSLAQNSAASAPEMPVAASRADITKFFGRDKPFCNYANNRDILIPKGTPKSAIKTNQGFWESSLSKFDGNLYGLKVVGVANFRMEGVGATAILFDETADRVLTILGDIYGKSSPYAQYFPASTAPDKAVACPDCEISGDHPEFTAIRNASHTRDFYGVGKSALECGFFD